MLTCESFIHNSNILFINKHVFSIIVCLFIITIDNNFFLSHFKSKSRTAVHNHNNIIVIKHVELFFWRFFFSSAALRKSAFDLYKRNERKEDFCAHHEMFLCTHRVRGMYVLRGRMSLLLLHLLGLILLLMLLVDLLLMLILLLLDYLIF